MSGLAHPHEGGKENQEQQYEPCHSRLTEVMFGVLVEYVAEKHEAKDTPDRQNEVGFPRHGADIPYIRYQQIYAEHY